MKERLDIFDLCAICEARLHQPPVVRVGKNRLVPCGLCGSWTCLPRPDAREYTALHDNPDYFEHPYFQQGRRKVTRALEARCREIFTRIAKGIEVEKLRGERVLDVGCDTGTFLTAGARLFGIIPVGVDVAGRAVQVASESGIEAYHCNIASAPEELKDFPLITAIDLIEHLIEPGEFLAQVQRRLRAGGVLYLETPNIRSLVYRAGSLLCRLTRGWPQSTFERLFPPEHLEYFTSKSLVGLARKHGLEEVWIGQRILPFRDLAVALPVRLGLTAWQVLDVLVGRRILICALFRRRTTGE